LDDAHQSDRKRTPEMRLLGVQVLPDRVSSNPLNDVDDGHQYPIASQDVAEKHRTAATDTVVEPARSALDCEPQLPLERAAKNAWLSPLLSV
jgi:hypothetical protein